MTSTLPHRLPRQRTVRRCAPPVTTPYLELDVPAAVDRFVDLAAALPGTAVHYAVKANPHPRLLAALAGARLPVRRRQPGRGAGRARRRRHSPTRSCTPTRSSAATTSSRRRRSGSGSSSSTPSTRCDKVAEAAPGQPGAVPAGHLRRGLGLAAVAQVRLLHRRGRRRCSPCADTLGLDAAGVSFHVGSQQRDPEAWADADRRRGPRLRRSCARAACSPGCSTSAAASRRRTRTAAAPVAAYGEAIERHLHAVLRRRPRRRPSSSPDAASSVTPGPWSPRSSASSTAAACAGCTSTPASSPVSSRPSSEAIRYRITTSVDGGDAHRPVRARRADLRQRRRALPGPDGRSCRSRSPRATRCGCSRPAPTPAATRPSGSTGSLRCRPSSRAAESRRCGTSTGPTRRAIVAHAIGALAVALPWPLLLVLVAAQHRQPVAARARRQRPDAALRRGLLADRAAGRRHAPRPDRAGHPAGPRRAAHRDRAWPWSIDHPWLAVVCCTLAVAIGHAGLPRDGRRDARASPASGAARRPTCWSPSRWARSSSAPPSADCCCTRPRGTLLPGSRWR